MGQGGDRDESCSIMDRTSKRLLPTTHATRQIKVRQIDIAEIKYALTNHHTELPGKNPGTSRIICDMPFGRRLSVVFKEKKSVIVIISAWWIEGGHEH